MEEEIKTEFERSGFSLEDDEEEILKKCLAFCINYKLTPADLISSWEVYYLNRQLSGTALQNAQMDGFLLHLENEQKDTLIKEEQQYPHIYSSNDVDMILSDENEDTTEGILVTPTKQPEISYSELTPETHGYMPSSGTSSRLANNHMTPFGQRSSKFVVQIALNKIHDTENDVKAPNIANHEDDVIRRVQPTERCSLEVLGLQPRPGCRFMYDRIEDRFDSLANRIRRREAGFVASGLYEEPADPTVSSQKSIFSVGMICCDGEGRLNEKSILLQGSVENSGGQRVRIDLQKLTQFSLFPGQVVGIEGNNPSGHCLVATKVVDSIPLSVSPDVDLPPAKKQAMDQEFQPTSTSKLKEISMIIAAGPFSTTDNLLFEPLTDLLAYASRKQPQLLMLLGPFVDSEHPEIKTGTVDRSYDDIFHVEILRRLQDYTEYMGSACRVILVPSIRDANHDYVFPQPAFDIHLSDLKHQISSIPNPGIFNANEVKVGCCTVDILKQLSGEEISRIPSGGSRDRMGRLATHLLSQRSFYPLYPSSEDVPLDLTFAPEALEISSRPDILVLPSDLAPFVKVLSLGGEITGGKEQLKCIAVNPGRLAKGVGGGTFVELNYHGDTDRINASVIRI